jgi:hypothetical protein
MVQRQAAPLPPKRKRGELAIKPCLRSSSWRRFRSVFSPSLLSAEAAILDSESCPAGGSVAFVEPNVFPRTKKEPEGRKRLAKDDHDGECMYRQFSQPLWPFRKSIGSLQMNA